ncbi:hypothetical protein N7453_002772 [Penicillium expansum]|nr:hypothetical protein N7453_002772 [Penicillium expansum]
MIRPKPMTVKQKLPSRLVIENKDSCSDLHLVSFTTQIQFLLNPDKPVSAWIHSTEFREKLLRERCIAMRRRSSEKLSSASQPKQD